MRILIAPDSFKECLPADAVAVAIERGIRRVWPGAVCDHLPMADGGEGTVSAILHTRRGKRKFVPVSGPLGGQVKAGYGRLADKRTAIIEMASASGLMLIALDKRNPLRTSSFGTGELIINAIDNGAKEIIIGLGGSATVDGGAGMAQALGVRFLDINGKLIGQKMSGGMLDRIAAIDMSGIHTGVRRTKVTIAADVENRLCGNSGAARVFGPQKGATAAMCRLLDKNLRQFAGVIKKDLNLDVLKIRGGGAAGGLGAGLIAFANADITSGIALVANLLSFDKRASRADLIITGEGRIDAQTGHGKVVAGITRMGKKLGVPVIAIGGSLADDTHALFDRGLSGLTSAVARDMTLADACLHASEYIANAAERTMRMIMIGRKLHD